MQLKPYQKNFDCLNLSLIAELQDVELAPYYPTNDYSWLFVWPFTLWAYSLINTSLQSQQAPSLLLCILELGLTTGQWPSINTVCKASVLPTLEAEITGAQFSGPQHVCVNYIVPGTNTNYKISSQNHLGDTKLQLNKTIPEAAVLFQTHYHLQRTFISNKGTVQRAPKTFTG